MKKAFSGFVWDDAKSQICLEQRGFDFSFASALFEDVVIERVDDRLAYPETRIQALGRIGGLYFVVVYTLRDGNECRIISARRAHGKEVRKWLK